jgi:hypothetical protein
MMQALLEDVANNTLGRGVSPTVSAGLDAFDALSLPKMPSSANAFEISNIQEDEAEAVLVRGPKCNNVTPRRKPP